jgi:hypothetical protein
VLNFHGFGLFEILEKIAIFVFLNVFSISYIYFKKIQNYWVNSTNDWLLDVYNPIITCKLRIQCQHMSCPDSKEKTKINKAVLKKNQFLGLLITYSVMIGFNVNMIFAHSHRNKLLEFVNACRFGGIWTNGSLQPWKIIHYFCIILKLFFPSTYSFHWTLIGNSKHLQNTTSLLTRIVDLLASINVAI